MRCLAGLLLISLFATTAHAAAPPRRISFRQDIYPLLARCLRCHRGSNPASGIRLDARSEWFGESNGRPLATPGHGRMSRLVRAVLGNTKDRLMPPPGRGKRLTADEVNRLVAWIDQGMEWDDKLLPPVASAHWAFQPIRRPAIPARSAECTTPIDAFVAAGWRSKRLSSGVETPRRILIRRLHLDLRGLPPTQGETEAFESDPAPDAYERLVDRLLASPHYGERRARHWLDQARYADSEGYESNHPRPYAWRYRDWVVGAFNRDLPFSEFIRLQIAGDEVRPYRDENLIATGFLAAARLSSNEEDKARQRNDVLVDIVNTTGSTFLGLTLHCAQCHNHKFDPITARDYYRLQAFFIHGQPGDLALSDPALQARYRASLPAGYQSVLSRRDTIFGQARTRLLAATRRAMPENERRALDVPPDRRTDSEEVLARQGELKLQFTAARIEREIPTAQRAEYDGLEKKLATLGKTVLDEPQTFGFLAPATASARVKVLPMKGFYPLPHEPARLSKLRARLLVGGDVHRWSSAVDPGWPAILGPTPAPATTPRLALAEWMGNRRNPLVARVYVNRLWQWHFGRGLVSTPSDFGVRGARPSHPELLDWLASEFLDSDGSTKHITRLIVLSRAYRLASNPHAGNSEKDPENIYLWRWTPRRLEAEVIRDALLAVSGDQTPEIGGAPDSDELKSRRRGIYLLQKRDHPLMLQGLFDGPSASAESCPQRAVSTVPLQALYLLNNRFVTDRAAAVARRIRSKRTNHQEQIRLAFRLVLGRLPDAAEQQSSARFLARVRPDQSIETLCQTLMCTNEFSYLE